MDSKATPTPWEEIDGQVFGADGFEIADPTQGPHLSKDYEALRPGAHWATTPDSHVERTEEEEKANAALIVRAVNAHDDLVEALGGAADDLADRLESARARGHDTIHINARVVETMVAEFRAALAKAGER